MGRVARRCATLRGGLRGSLGTQYVAAVRKFRRLMRQKVSLHINFTESQQQSQQARPRSGEADDYYDREDDDSFVNGLFCFVTLYLFNYKNNFFLYKFLF